MYHKFNLFPLLSPLDLFVQFFVEDPGGPAEDIQTAALSVNVSNSSRSNYLEDKNRFYLPVGTAG